MSKMKVLLFGSHMNYNLEHYVYMSLSQLGHKVDFYGYRERLGRLSNLVRMAMTRSNKMREVINLLWLNEINDEIKEKANTFRPHLVLSIKGEALKPKTVEWVKRKLGAITALWYPDDPRYFESLVRHIAPSYDYVFTASKKAIPLYRQIGAEKVCFLPFACEPSVHKKVNLTQDEKMMYQADVLFVGTYTPRRARLIKKLERARLRVEVYGPYWKYFRDKGNVHGSIFGPEMVKAINAATIVLNIHVEDDLPYKLNMRNFEVTGAGSLLLTDRAYGLENAFSVGEELACYHNEEEIIDLANYYLGAPEEREEMGAKGQIRAYTEHTYRKRITEILQLAS